VDRREFLLAAAAAPIALRSGTHPLAYVTADTQSHVAVVDLAAARVVRRIATRPGPRSIERVGERYVVAHTAVGAISILEGSTVRHVVESFEEPRYTAGEPTGRYAFVTDSGRIDLATVDIVRGEVVARLKLKLWPRHLSLTPDGRGLWVSLGTASPELAVVDVRDPRTPRLIRYVRPPFAAHDVGFAPSGRVWVTGGAASSIAVQDHALAADGAPQHVTFLGGRAFVTSGADGTLRVYRERTARLERTVRVPVGSFNVQHVAGRVVTPSLNAGTLAVLDGPTIHVAPSCHDAA
jgi:DNA-binding beta-propeller fold protein YncE